MISWVTLRGSLVRRAAAILGAGLLLVALVPAGVSANTPITGAAFTTTNTGVDGDGHCQNGQENINCNIYDGKEFVWLNGGPSVAYVGDGDYFFAVLSPGGQPAPNDDGTSVKNGELANLSDNYDAYTDRTFSVSGATVTYSGPHDSDSNKIRLMPYADTPNPGGVYILAICSLADGYPVNPSDCKYDAFKIREGSETPQGDPLSVTKDADGSYDNTYAWTITKDVDKTLVRQIGGNVTFNYTVTVTHDGGTIGNIKVTGTITVFNPNIGDVTGVDVTDELSDGTTCTVTGGSDATVGTGDTDFAYSCDVSGQGSLDNTVSINWPAQTITDGDLAGGSDDFTFTGIAFTENAVDECVDVTDTYAGALGTVCVGDANPTTFNYSRTVAIPANDCVSYDNTAAFTTKDTGATDSASQTVTVCGPARTGALTIGFWKTTNGQALIKTYCQNPALANYLINLGGAPSGPFANAPTSSCTALATYVQGILSAAKATNMNTMLKAQMLGTALDVWFSGPGWTSTKSGGTKPPSTFLSHNLLGTFKMDTTAICPMVDNLSTGTATCKNNTPSTNAVTAGAVPTSPMTMQAILDFASTLGASPWTTGAFTGTAANSTWYGSDRTKQEILKNIFDQFNNRDAFGSF
jgi:hypothetical protein